MDPARPRVLAAALCLVFAAVSSSAAPAADEGPRAPLQRLNKELLNIRNNLQNAQMKYRNGVVDSGLEPDADRPPTPMVICCSSNLKRIKKRIQELREAVADLRACHEQAQDRDALYDLEFFLVDFTQFERGVGLWFKAKEREDVRGIQAALTRAFILMRKSADKLQACETGQSSVAVPEDQ